MQFSWSNDNNYINLYYLNNLNDFASCYKLQKYRYTKFRVDSLIFLDNLDNLD